MNSRNQARIMLVKERWKRYAPVLLIIAAGAGFSLLVFAAIRGQETRKLRTDFAYEAGNRSRLITRAIEDSLQGVESIRYLYSSSQCVERHEFREYVTPLFSANYGIRALAWIPRVSHARREQFEAAARQGGLADFRIVEKDQQGRLTPARQRDDYFPIYFGEPFRGNSEWMGLDLGADPGRREILARARDRGKIIVTERTATVDSPKRESSVWAYLPVYKNETATDTVEARRRNLAGFVAGVFHVGDLVEENMAYLHPQGVNVSVEDRSAPPKTRLLYFHASRAQKSSGLSTAAFVPDHPRDLRHTATLDAGGRQWTVTCTPIPAFSAARRTWYPWGMLGGGLMVTGLLAAYFLVVAGRTAQIKRLVEERTRQLRRSETQFRLLAENASDVIWTADLNLKWTYFSPSIERLRGVTAEEAMAETVAEMMTPASAALVLQTYAEEMALASEDPKAVTRPRTLELEIFRKDGSTVWTEVNASFLRDDDSQPVGLVGIVRDITERRQVAAELAKAKEAAEAASRAKSEFLANTSHEIRTPMTAILGYADLLTNSDLPKEEQRAHLQTIHRNARILLNLIDDILDLSKIEAGKMSLEPRACSPFHVVEEVMSLMPVRAAEKGLAMNVDYVFPLPPTIHVDSDRLRQILVNLVGNAVKFTEHGEIRLTVCCTGRTSTSPRMQFTVTDTGIGMSPEETARLFERFTQADASTTRRFGGTGLGLTVSQRLAEMLGGDIDVISSPGRGSTFTLTIDPGSLEGVRWLQGPLEAPDQRTGPPAADLPVELRGRLLLAEDGLDNQRLIRLVLEKAGLEVDLAENGKIACRMAAASQEQGRPYDLILMDIQMPEMDGYEATRCLRSQGWSRPVIALTAHAMAAERERCLQAGCNDHVAKPIDRAGLLATIVRHLDQAPEDVPQQSPAPA